MSKKKAKAKVLQSISVRRQVQLLAVLVIVMVGLAFAAVPLYRLFCQVTGFGGTTQVATAIPDKPENRIITVQFDAEVAQGLPWSFKALDKPVRLKVGQSYKAVFEAKNLSQESVTGVSVYNVTPLRVGKYFQKVECFCFSKQLLKPGESEKMPVTFFIDPKIMTDKELKDVDVVTLSYTFFKAKTDALKKAQDDLVKKEQEWQKNE